MKIVCLLDRLVVILLKKNMRSTLEIELKKPVRVTSPTQIEQKHNLSGNNHFFFYFQLNTNTQSSPVNSTTSMVQLPLKFKAGRVQHHEESNIYTPVSIKGEITIKQSEEGEGFYNFQWKPRSTITETTVSATLMEPEELLVFAGDVTWRRVKSCGSGRVYQLTFISSGAKHLFWMQESNDDDFDLSKETELDLKIYAKINELFAEPADADAEED